MPMEQLTVPVSTESLQDIDVVVGLLKVNRSEWIKTKLAEEAQREKNRLLMELSTLYAKGMITKKNVEELAGKEIADGMESTLKTADLSIEAARHYAQQQTGKFHT